MKKYKVLGCKVMMKELYTLAAVSDNIVDICFMEQELHNTPEKLNQILKESIVDVENENSRYDAILLAYGLCSNGVIGIKAINTPIVIPRGHDCITMLLGSKEKYEEVFNRHDGGIYWYSSGWIDHTLQPSKERYEKIYQEYVDNFGEENAKYLIDMEQNWMQEYNCATFIRWKEFDDGRNEKYIKYTKECADYLEWEYTEEAGSSKLLYDFINGNWDSERFLVLEPGQEIAATNDNSIIGMKENGKK